MGEIIRLHPAKKYMSCTALRPTSQRDQNGVAFSVCPHDQFCPDRRDPASPHSKILHLHVFGPLRVPEQHMHRDVHLQQVLHVCSS